MTNDERKPIVKQLLAEGKTLSEIQTYLHQEKKDAITYMELRLLLSEMPEVTLPEKERPKLPPTVSAPATAAEPATTGRSEPGASAGQKVSITVEQMPRPGSMLSGYARFPSGAKANWFIDQMGRVGVEPELGSDKPTSEDMQAFTTELRRMLQSGGM